MRSVVCAGGLARAKEMREEGTLSAAMAKAARLGMQRPGMSANEPFLACMPQAELQDPAL